MSEDVMELVLHRGQKGLGFNIKGGEDLPYIENHPGIFVTKIRDQGAAADDGRLRQGDQILELNGHSLENVKHEFAVNLFRNAQETVRIKVLSGSEASILRARSKSVDNGNHSTRSSLAYYIIGLGTLVIAAALAYKYRPRNA